MHLPSAQLQWAKLSGAQLQGADPLRRQRFDRGAARYSDGQRTNPVARRGAAAIGMAGPLEARDEGHETRRRYKLKA
jgi:hypothetical protein